MPLRLHLRRGDGNAERAIGNLAASVCAQSRRPKCHCITATQLSAVKFRLCARLERIQNQKEHSRESQQWLSGHFECQFRTSSFPFGQFPIQLIAAP
jgi:hypothetical protein